MYHVNSLIGWIMLALQLLALGAGVFAIFHAARQRQDAFTAVEKLSKPIWLGILIVALLALLVMPLPGLFGIVAVVAICVYLVDVRPRVDEIQRGPRW
ncbi:DUF2516 family protein [Rhodococcus sp. NPDC127528]|uniref:DUF2516 family protein n=1 Tax=unclassified Rhodococcus (in: high G+C Gram-positive bacteria) TaxID=192944 RepID=UPI00363E0E43